jgi:hypothetical protein
VACDHGFLARSSAGSQCAIVGESPLAKRLPKQVEGQTQRILGGVWK